MKVTACACVFALFATISTTITATQLDDPCRLLTVDEVKSAFGRKTLSAGKLIREPDINACQFAAAGAGDVVIMLHRERIKSKADFALLREISAEQVKAEIIAGLDGAGFYYDDQLDFLAGDRVVSLLVDRTPRTESPAVVKAALTRLAKRVGDRLRAAR